MIEKIRAAVDTLNNHLIEAARLGIKIDVMSGITPPIQDSVDKSHFYIAKCVVIVVKNN
jgi:hypothetical protein